MLDQLTLDSFEPYLNQTFHAQLGNGNNLDLTLAECAELGRRGNGRQQFHVVFVGPLQPVLPQRIYRLEHEKMGALEIFIVPIGPDQRGMRYEAIFT